MSPRFPHISRLNSPTIETPRLVKRPTTPSENAAPQNPTPTSSALENTTQDTAETHSHLNGTPAPETVQEFVAETEPAPTEIAFSEVTASETAFIQEVAFIQHEEPSAEAPVLEVTLEVSTQVVESVVVGEQNADETESEEFDSDEIEDELDEAPYTSGTVSRRAQREQSSAREFDVLFAEWKATGDPRLRERLILMNRNLVSYIARRFMDRGEMSEDIIQQGLIGLINALDHFDPSRGVRFATFATPTIMGEIRRYFRDKSWGIRVPRRLQELNQVINSRIDELTQTLDRSPTYVEIARSLNLQLEEVVEALEMASVLDPMSIDEEVSFGNNDSPTTVGDQIGAPDPQLEGWGEYAALQAALEKLPEKERRVLEMVYFNDHSQVEVARQMNVSQMFVSRLQRRALAHLRELMNGHDI